MSLNQFNTYKTHYEQRITTRLKYCLQRIKRRP